MVNIQLSLICYWVNLLLKVEHISYTMGTCSLPDIYTHLPSGPQGNAYISGKALMPILHTCTCNTFTPEIKGAARGYIWYVAQLARLIAK